MVVKLYTLTQEGSAVGYDLSLIAKSTN